MKRLLVLQHTEAEYLGLIEDHLEARRIGFQYVRPFVDKTWQLKAFGDFDGLILLGGGPWGSAGVRDVPSLAGEIQVCKDFLAAEKPVLGLGLGAQILALAAGGGSEPAAFVLDIPEVVKTAAGEGELPDGLKLVQYGRDRFLPPPGAEILATDKSGNPLVFTVNRRAMGLIGHPGLKSGIVEDLIMEFEESPEDVVEGLQHLRAQHPQVEQSLNRLMILMVRRMGWMDPD